MGLDATQWLLLLGAGFLAGVINSVSSGGSFFTYPALLLIGLSPLSAATTTLAALTPGNLAAVPEFWPEVRAERHRYRRDMAIVFAGGVLGIGLLFWTGADFFADLAPWLILTATAMFALSPRIGSWAERGAPSVSNGSLGALVIFVFSIYLTYFGSGVGNVMLAIFTIRGFGDFLSANAAKNITLTIGTGMATIAYGFAGYIAWRPLLPIFIASALGGLVGSKLARQIPNQLLRWFVISFGVFVAVWQLVS